MKEIDYHEPARQSKIIGMQTIYVSQNLKTSRDYFFRMSKINLTTLHRPKLLVIQPIPFWSEIRTSFCLYGGKRKKGKIVLHNGAGGGGEGGMGR